MSQSDRAIKQLAKELARLKREVVSGRGPQADFTSLEDDGAFTFKGADGSVKAVVGGQPDGGNTINVIDTPTPPAPSAPLVAVDGPVIRVEWDGGFTDGSSVPTYFESVQVEAVHPLGYSVRSHIFPGAESMSVALVAEASGTWTVTLTSVSQSGKKSAPSVPVDAQVSLVDLDAALDDVAQSANGKNTNYYSPTEPTPPAGGFTEGDIWFDTSEAGANTPSIWDGTSWVSMADARVAVIEAAQDQLQADLVAVEESANGKNSVHFDTVPPTSSDAGIAGDTWWVGTMGRPNDVVQATNLMLNPSFEGSTSGWQSTTGTTLIEQTSYPAMAGRVGGSMGEAKVDSGYTRNFMTIEMTTGTKLTVSPGQWVGARFWAATDPDLKTRIQLRFGPAYDASPFQSSTFYPGAYFSRVAQVPAGESTAWVQAQTFSTDGNPIPQGKRFWVDQVMMVVADTQAECEAMLSTYFDGDTVDGTTLDEPHYRWTGTSHASTSEKFLPALDIGPTTKWNVVAEYRHDGTAWVEVALSHEVISTLDAAKILVGYMHGDRIEAGSVNADVVMVPGSAGSTVITNGAITTEKIAAGAITAESGVIGSLDLGVAMVGYLHGSRVEAGTVTADQLSADFADFMVAHGATLIGGDNRVILDDSGLTILDSNGDWRIRMSPTGAVFKGDLEAETLVATGPAEFRSTGNKLAQGARLTLEAGVTDPTSPPIVQPFWEQIQADTTDTGTQSQPLSGLAWDGTYYWTTRQGLRDGSFDVARITTTGDVLPISFTAIDADEYYGVTCIGSELFFFYRRGYKAYVLVTSLTNAIIREWEYPDLGFSETNKLVYKPGIGTDGTNVVISQCNDAGPINIRTYNKDTGALITRVIDYNDDTASDITGVYVGTADWGRTLATVGKRSSRSIPSFDPTTGVYDGVGTHFDPPPGSDVAGFCWDGTQFVSISSSGTITYYMPSHVGGGDWWGAYAWMYEDPNDADNVVDESTMASPSQSFAWPLRSSIRMIAPPLPQGVTGITPYVADTATEPVRTDFHAPAWWHEGSKAWYETFPADWETYPSPRTSNSFPAATPSEIVSASSTYLVRGDGSGRWGPLTFHPDGTMTSSAIPDWVPLTTFKTGFTAQTWGYAPAYRIWPDGKVEWRGAIQGTIPGASNDTVVADIPSEAIPQYSTQATSACSFHASGSVCRTEFTSVTKPTALNVYPGGVDRSWVSLDGIYYYLT